MKIAYFDTIAGISGDMTLGAFISAGMSLDILREEIGKLHLDGVELIASHLQRNSITAVKLDVVISVTQEHHRHLKDIFAIIDRSALIDRVKEDAKKIFMEVAKAEAMVHNSTVEKIHFHEVGALDSIVDIVGAAICFQQMGIQKVYSSPVKLGSGNFIKTEHGMLPLPGPATVEILRNYPTVLTDIPYELTTPTGAAILKAMSAGVLSMEQLNVESIGYGAGTREIPLVPNILRVMIGDLQIVYEEDEVVMIETNIDDMNPEIYPFVMEQLFALGALDVYLVPVIMKKGRPGTLLSFLGRRTNLDELLRVVYTHTTTLGVRIQPVMRKKIERHEREVKSRFGIVKVKEVLYDGRVRLVPEFEECKRLAVEKNLPIIDVYTTLYGELSV
jgi:uncharacterized protein (TIGR00299 family) protein